MAGNIIIIYNLFIMILLFTALKEVSRSELLYNKCNTKMYVEYNTSAKKIIIL